MTKEEERRIRRQIQLRILFDPNFKLSQPLDLFRQRPDLYTPPPSTSKAPGR